MPTPGGKHQRYVHWVRLYNAHAACTAGVAKDPGAGLGWGMAIRAPGQSPIPRPGAGVGQGPGTAAPSAADALSRLGLFGQSMLDPQAAMAKLLGFLMLQGFGLKGDAGKPGGPGGDDATKLADALKQLQGKEGLPQTGRLDERTLKAMEKYRPAQGSERATERQVASQQTQRDSRMATSFRDQTLAAWIKNKAPELQKPQTQQSANQASTAQQMQHAVNAGRPDQALPPQLQQEAAQKAAQQQAQNPQTAGRPSEDAVRPTVVPQDARAPKEAASSQANQQGAGQGKKSAEDAARLQQAQAQAQAKGTGKADTTQTGRAGGEAGLARGDAEQLVAFEDGRGNQATGDEDEEDERRGAALVDDGSGEDEGAYEMPSLAAQVREALGAVEVETDTGINKATTYRVSLQLYRPGVYQSRTMAPQLLNLKVMKATAYDEIWEKVMEQVNARLRAFEPDSSELDMDQVHTALAVARARAS